MYHEILKGIYQMKIPLPGNPLRSLNSYLIKGDKRCLLVDTGFNWPECKKALVQAMDALRIDWSEVDFFITHVHGDHSGLVYELAHDESRIYCSQVDAEIMKACMRSDYWVEVNSVYSRNGFPNARDRNQAATMNDFISGSDLNFHYVREGDIIAAGEYNLVCIATPGHTPGHICLYEPDCRFFISGDHILGDITPNITPWLGVEDSLGMYLNSLEKVNSMTIDLVLPGHRAVVLNHRERIAEIKHHHQTRLKEVLDILQIRPMDAYQTASHMHWDLTYDTWDDYPSFQKWFAVGEAIAHLEHLIKLNLVTRTLNDQKMTYSIAS